MPANAEALPFDDDSVDGYTIAFGIRNVTHIDRALAEAHRVCCSSLVYPRHMPCCKSQPFAERSRADSVPSSARQEHVIKTGER